MKWQEAQMLWTVLFTGENGHKRRWGDAAFCLWQVCVVWSVCSLTHWTHYFDLAESISPTSLALESVKAGVCKLYWVKAEASGWVGGEAGEGALFFRGLLFMHYIFSNSLNLENKQLQQLPSGICSTCVCVLLSFNASCPNFAPFDFGNIIFIRHEQKH